MRKSVSIPRRRAPDFGCSACACRRSRQQSSIVRSGWLRDATWRAARNFPSSSSAARGLGSRSRSSPSCSFTSSLRLLLAHTTPWRPKSRSMATPSATSCDPSCVPLLLLLLARDPHSDSSRLATLCAARRHIPLVLSVRSHLVHRRVAPRSSFEDEHADPSHDHAASLYFKHFPRDRGLLKALVLFLTLSSIAVTATCSAWTWMISGASSARSRPASTRWLNLALARRQGDNLDRRPDAATPVVHLLPRRVSPDSTALSLTSVANFPFSPARSVFVRLSPLSLALPPYLTLASRAGVSRCAPSSCGTLGGAGSWAGASGGGCRA